MPSARRRLLIVSQPPIAGVPRHVLDLLAQLPDHWDVDVACPRGTDLWQGLESDPSVRLHPIAPDRAPSLADVRTFVSLLAMVRRADLVHAHSSKAGFLVRLAAICVGRSGRCIFTPHGWSFWAFSGGTSHFYASLERIAARWCARIIAVSNYERDAGLAQGIGRPGQYVVVANGIETARFAADPVPVPGRIVMVARLDAPKLPVLAIEAIALVRQRHPGATLELVGDGPLRAESQARANALGLGDGVRFLGQRGDVPTLLAGASVALHASRYEGSPLTVMEAMAAGVPIVATAAGGMDELVREGETGFVTPFDAQAIADRIVELLDDPAKAAAMGDVGRQRARLLYDRRNMAAATYAEYEKLAPA